MNVRLSERILNTEIAAKKREKEGSERVKSPNLSEGDLSLSLSLSLPSSPPPPYLSRPLGCSLPLSPPVSADPSCADIHLFVKESPPVTIRGKKNPQFHSQLSCSVDAGVISAFTRLLFLFFIHFSLLHFFSLRPFSLLPSFSFLIWLLYVQIGGGKSLVTVLVFFTLLEF